MAVRIVRQPRKIALIGAPSSAAAFAPGLEKAPVALRAAGLVEKLRSAGYEVADMGDCPPRFFAEDDEHPRARNAAAVVAGLNDLRLQVELAVKSGAVVLVLGGECVQSLALVAGARRYYRHVNLLWLDRDADLNTPATTPSGRLDGMALAHFIGRGAAELVRFWGEPPLVREPDITLFGVERLDPPEQEFLNKSPMRRVLAADALRKGAGAAAEQALREMYAETRDYMLHFDVDVIAQEELRAVNVPGSGGFALGDTRAVLRAFVSGKNLLGLDVAQYNPDKDADGSGARLVVDLLADAFSARAEALSGPAAEPSAESGEGASSPAS